MEINDFAKWRNEIDQMNEAKIDHIGHKVDPKKFDVYMKYTTKNKIDRQTVLMIIQFVFDEKGKKLSAPIQYMVDRFKQDLKNPKMKEAVKLFQAARIK